MFAKSDATQEIVKIATEDFHYKHGVCGVYTTRSNLIN